jgi:ParB-like chromosome segregation protein Spo0J
VALKKKIRGKAKLTRAQLVYVKSNETVADLERRVATVNARPKACPKSLPLGTIRVADKVFQWRMPSENIVAKEDHIFDLANALRDREKPLDPILVFPVGERYYVVDGHHRINAYHSAKWKNPIPVMVFNGSFQDARIEAFRRNSKNKLAMTKQDKMEGTWRLVKEENLSISETSDATGASPSQISIMRNVWTRLCADQEHKDDASELSWAQARMALAGIEIEVDDEWKQKEAQKLVDALLKAKIGQGLMKHPDITARALSMINERLPRTLVWEWFGADELQSMIDELGEPDEF